MFYFYFLMFFVFFVPPRILTYRNPVLGRGGRVCFFFQRMVPDSSEFFGCHPLVLHFSFQVTSDKKDKTLKKPTSFPFPPSPQTNRCFKNPVNDSGRRQPTRSFAATISTRRFCCFWMHCGNVTSFKRRRCVNEQFAP